MTRKAIKQHTTLSNPEYNYSPKVVQQKRRKEEKKRVQKEIEKFLRTVDEDQDTTKGNE